MSVRSAAGGVAGLLALGLVLTLGLTELYRIRFSRGDLYPPASSLRADPLGAKVLHDALRELPGLIVERHRRPLAELGMNRRTAVLVLGLAPLDFAEEGSALADDAAALAGRGARVVLAFAPTVEVPEKAIAEKDARSPEGAAGTGRASGWRRATAWLALPKGADGLPAPARAHLEAGAAASDLPAELPLHTALVFDPAMVDARSRVLYRRDGRPVVLEIAFGEGSLALLADGFPFANEGVSRERQAALLAWALGDAERVVFDESHLGVEERSGVMVLARRYRLLPLLAGLALLAALFVWRAASSLVPPPATPTPDGRTLPGGDAASGLTRLLERGIAPRDLLALCAERWAHDCGRNDEATTKTVAEMARRAQDPVAGYREIRAALAPLPFRRGDHVD